MRYFPLFMDISGKKVVVIGGGRIAERRILTLSQFGCLITLVSPRVTGVLEKMAEESRVRWIAREYQAGDCQGCFLALAATDDPKVNQAAAEEARRAGAMANVCDHKDKCDFYFPAIVTQGEDVVVGITASGADHKLAAALKRRIEENMDGML